MGVWEGDAYEWVASSCASTPHLLRPQLTPVDMRVESLREDYGFTCECERCTSELVNMDKVRSHAL